MLKNKILCTFLGGAMSVVLIFSYGLPQGFVRADAATFDFGDAPDSGYFTFYSGTGVAKFGSFPSKSASDGARTSTTSEVWLGQKVDSEADSKQVDGDKFDDGVGVDLKAEATSKAYVFVHVKKPGETTGTAYINMFFDWNRDGKWDGNDGVADEWAVRNFPVDLSAQTKDVMVYIPEFTAGKKVENIWYRAILTLDDRLTYENQNGQGSFSKGEVEDYGPKLRPGKRYGVVCKPDLKVIEHGKSGKLRIRKKYANSPAISQVLFANSVAPRSQNNTRSNNKTRDIKIRGVNKNGAVVIYKSKKKDPPKRVVFDSFDVRVRFGPKGKEASVTTKCNVAVVHAKLKGIIMKQNVHDYTLTGVEGKFTESKELMGDTQVTRIEGSLKPIDTEMVAMNLTGFEIPLDSQHPKMSLPQYIDLNINGAGQGSWQCELIPSTTGGAGTKRCQGNEPLQFNVNSFFDVFFDVAVNLTNSLHMHLLDSSGNVIGAVDLPKE